MKQAVMTAPGEIVFRDIEPPKPGPGEVLLRISTYWRMRLRYACLSRETSLYELPGRSRS